MNLRDLTEPERDALAAGLYLLVNADGRVRHQERQEIDALGRELQSDGLGDRVASMGDHVRELDDLLPLVRQVERDDAREMIRTVLIDAAQSDGLRTQDENAVIDRITREWARDI